MKVSFNPAVSFKQNLIEEKKNETMKIQSPLADYGMIRQYPTSWGPNPNLEEIKKKTDEFLKNELNKEVNSTIQTPKMRSLTPEEIEKNQKEFMATLEEGKSLDGIIKGTHWEKEYDKFNKTVHMKIPNSYDGIEYTIYPDGKVVSTSGWGRNKVEMEANEKMANYVKAMKDGKVEEYLEKEYKVKSGDKLEEEKLAEKSKADLFKETIHNRQWEKEYLPESDIIVIKQRKVKDGTEYMMEKDGTVKELLKDAKPEVIIEPSIEGAKEFGKLKAKLSGENDEVKTSLWYKMKKAVAGVWKFFQVTSTMSVAAAKGLAEGVVVGAGVLAGTTILRGAYKVITTDTKLADIAKNPLKTAGKFGGLLSVAAGGAVLAAEVIAGRMKANQQSAVIEHKLDVAHDLG